MPKPPLPPLASTARCAERGEIGEQGLAVLLEDLRAHRNPQHHVGAARAGAVLAHAVHAVLGLEMLLIAVIDQRVEAVHAFGDHVAAAAAIAAVRPAELDEFLAPERDAAGAAVAGADVDLGLIEEFHDSCVPRYVDVKFRPPCAKQRAGRAPRQTAPFDLDFAAARRRHQSPPSRWSKAQLLLKLQGSGIGRQCGGGDFAHGE